MSGASKRRCEEFAPPKIYFKRAKTAPQGGVDEALAIRAKRFTGANQKTLPR